MSVRRAPFLAFAAFALLPAAPALAQKSADKVRLALTDPIQTTLLYNDQKPETQLFAPSIYDTLMCYDRQKGAFTPSLAKSWKRIDDLTLEFELRDDVKFHDGSPFTADDVVYTLNWVIDPANKLRFAPADNNLGWIEKAEKTGPHAVRIKAKAPTPLAMIRLAVMAPIVNAKAHAALADKSTYGRAPALGTGPYKVASFDSTRGVELVRNDDYRHASACKPAAAIAKAQVIQIPDEQTRLAQLMVGGIDIAKASTKDETEALGANPALAISVIPDAGLHHLMLDAADRSGKKILADVRVRRAIGHALDRAFIARAVLPGGEAIKAPDALCTPTEIACDFTQKAPGYDVAKAKALLAEAGFPSGFSVEITSLPTSYPLADAVAGELRKAGVRASVDKATFTAFRTKQAENKLQILIGMLPILTSLDASSHAAYFFDKNPRNYSGDPEMITLNKAGLTELDLEKRKAIYRKLYDRANEQAYVLPLVSTPDVFVHAKDLTIATQGVHPEGLHLNDLKWK